MEEKELQALLAKVSEETRKEVELKMGTLKEELTQGFIDEDKFKEMSEDLLKDAVKAEDLVTLKDSIEALAIEFKTMRETKETEKKVTLKEQITERS